MCFFSCNREILMSYKYNKSVRDFVCFFIVLFTEKKERSVVVFIRLDINSDIDI